MTRTPLHLNLLLILFTGFFLNPRPLQPVGGTGGTQPDFPSFYASVQNGEADVVRGVYVEHVLALPVVQQPVDRPYYVSAQAGEVTQFALTSQYGTIGLLAHNTLAGGLFSQIGVGQEVRLVYGAGKIKYFVVKNVLRFQALQPESVTSSFRNLDRSEVLSAGDMFARAYIGGARVVFQTCIEADGNASWGRLFVVAVPEK